MATTAQAPKVAAPKIRIRLRSYDHRMLDDSLVKIVDVVKRTGAVLAGPVLLPVQIKKYTVLRSPHTDKKSRSSQRRPLTSFAFFYQHRSWTAEKLRL